MFMMANVLIRVESYLANRIEIDCVLYNKKKNIVILNPFRSVCDWTILIIDNNKNSNSVYMMFFFVYNFYYISNIFIIIKMLILNYSYYK